MLAGRQREIHAERDRKLHTFARVEKKHESIRVSF
jgi:hypothetical protein